MRVNTAVAELGTAYDADHVGLLAALGLSTSDGDRKAAQPAERRECTVNTAYRRLLHFPALPIPSLVYLIDVALGLVKMFNAAPTRDRSNTAGAA